MEVTDKEISIGDEIRIGEEDVGLEQRVESMQVNHQQVPVANIGDEVGLKVNGAVRPGDLVYKVN